MSKAEKQQNHLPQELTFRDSFLFPIATPDARRDMMLGGLVVLFLLPIGWILNLGARLDVVHRLYTGDVPYFREMRPWSHTFKRGCVSAFTIFSYLLPANLSFGLGAWITYSNGFTTNATLLVLGGLVFFLVGVFILPGCMTVYACEEDPTVLRQPIRAFQRAWSHRALYFKAWLIALASIVISLLGLFVFLIGFFFTSVWAWEVVGYAFTIAMYTEVQEAAE